MYHCGSRDCVYHCHNLILDLLLSFCARTTYDSPHGIFISCSLSATCDSLLSCHRPMQCLAGSRDVAHHRACYVSPDAALLLLHSGPLYLLPSYCLAASWACIDVQSTLDRMSPRAESFDLMRRCSPEAPSASSCLQSCKPRARRTR